MTPGPQTARPLPTPLDQSTVQALVRDTTPWLSCEECFERMDTYAESVLTGAAVDDAMSTHLRACAACDEEVRSLVDLLRSR